ncbi:MAG: DUF2784 domain-containing protein [Pirellulaceae bacterium]
MTFYGFLADTLVAIHAVWVGVVVFGLLAILIGAWLRWRWVRNFWIRIIHLGMIGFVVFEAVLGIPCPLTVWEDRLRRAVGESVQEGSFVGRWVHSLILYDFPPWVFTIVYCIFGAVVLGTMLFVPPRRRRMKDEG